MSLLPFMIKPRFHTHTWEPASTTTHSCRWPRSICGAVSSFGTEIWVRIQSSWGAVLSRSDLEKVVHSKFHLTHREAGRPWLDRNKNGGWRCSGGEYSFLNNVKWLQAVISPWILHFVTLLGPLLCWFEGRLRSKKLCFTPPTHTHSYNSCNSSVSWLFYLCEVDSTLPRPFASLFRSFFLSILSMQTPCQEMLILHELLISGYFDPLLWIELYILLLLSVEIKI